MSFHVLKQSMCSGFLLNKTSYSSIRDLIFPHQVDDVTVSVPPRLLKLNVYFVACSKSQFFDGAQLLLWKRWREQGGVVLLQVS